MIVDGVRKTLATTTRRLPNGEWPDWARQLAQHAQPGDTGLGDVAERVIGPFGSDAFKLWWAEVNPDGVFGKTCKCASWKPRWNWAFPVDIRA
jgi:hypothetical protein